MPIRFDVFLVFLFWGPISIVSDKPKGFRGLGLFTLALMCVGLWFALFPRGELTGSDSYTLLVFAVLVYIGGGIFYHRCKND